MYDFRSRLPARRGSARDEEEELAVARRRLLIRQDLAMPSREEILQEIRRAAARNRGKPVGRDRFRQLTGISEYALAQHWPTYGEAVRDAGLEPNTLNAALDDDAVFGRFVELTRELGHVPTSNELRRARANDPSFPSSGVFERLGSKDERVAGALERCRNTPVDSDVVAILEAHAPRGDGPVGRSSEGPRNEISYGFVYLARGHRGEYKIGRTNLVDRRVAELGATSAVELSLIHEIKTDDPVGVEAYWHSRFADKRMRGEWFRLGSRDIAAFRRWKRIA